MVLGCAPCYLCHCVALTVTLLFIRAFILSFSHTNVCAKIGLMQHSDWADCIIFFVIFLSRCAAIVVLLADMLRHSTKVQRTPEVICVSWLGFGEK